jgi:hypothetical protein
MMACAKLILDRTSFAPLTPQGRCGTSRQTALSSHRQNPLKINCLKVCAQARRGMARGGGQPSQPDHNFSIGSTGGLRLRVIAVSAWSS